MEGTPLKKSIHTLVSMRLPEVFTFLHPFHLEFFHLLPVQVKMNLAAQGEELLLPPAANVVCNGQADGFGFFFSPVTLRRSRIKGSGRFNVARIFITSFYVFVICFIKVLSNTFWDYGP